MANLEAKIAFGRLQVNRESSVLPERCEGLPEASLRQQKKT